MPIVITAQTEVYKQQRCAALDYHQQMCHHSRSEQRCPLPSALPLYSIPLLATLYDHLNNFPAILLTLRNRAEPNWAVIMLATRSQSDCQTDRETKRRRGRQTGRQADGPFDSQTVGREGPGRRTKKK